MNYSYLLPFVKNDFNTNAMKVLSKIIQYVELPKIFINSYIKHVIANFKNETKKDVKTKMARLIAFFITNLIEHEHLNKESDIPNEVKFFYNDLLDRRIIYNKLRRS